MYSQAVIFLTVIKVLVITFGIALNGFIVTVNLVWWWKSRTLQAVDLIILNLGLARLIHLIIYSIYNFLSFMNIILYNSEYISEIFVVAVMCMYNYNLCTGALLCISYCVKITNYSHKLFTYLKLNLPRLVPRFLLAFFSISFACCLPYQWFLYDTETINSTNVTGEFHEQRIVLNSFNQLIIFIIGAALPLFLFCSAFSLLIRSLWSHSQHMKSVSCGFRPPQLDAHRNAIKNMLSFIFLYLISFVSCSLFPLSLKSKNNLYVLLCMISVLVYPSLHSFVLIWSHRRLKHLIWRPVHWAMGKKSDRS